MSDKKEEIYFGPNIWLIDEMYRQFLESPEAVAESWRDFFTDYKPDSLVPPVPEKEVKKEVKKNRESGSGS